MNKFARSRILYLILPMALAGGLLFALFTSANAATPPSTSTQRTAATLTICASGCDYSLIQTAIGAAMPNDILQILDPVHTEEGILVSKPLTIEGLGPENTIIQAAINPLSATNRIFRIQTGVTATIRDMKMRYGAGAMNFGFHGGGAILNSGNLTLLRTHIQESSADFGGGILNVSGALTITDSIIFSNTGLVEGGGIYNWQNVGPAIILIDSTTIWNNQANGAGASMGGAGLENDGGNISLVNCTISGNSSSNGSARGGGLLNFKGTMTVNFCTVADNLATTGGGISNNDAQGATTTVKNSIIGDNSDLTIAAPDLAGSFVSADYNLIESSTGYTLTGSTTNNIVGSDPSLNALADNGGETPTHALGGASPANDHIPNSTNDCGTLITDDQRGVARPSGLACEIGAFERTFFDLAVTKIDSTDPVAVGSPLTYLVTVANVGNSAAMDVTLTDTLPAELTFISATPGPPTCNEASGIVVCDLNTINAFDSVSIFITAMANSPGLVTNSAVATSDFPEEEIGNNSDTEDTTLVVPITSLDLTGPASGLLLSDLTFLATAQPITATTPLTFVWTATDQEAVTSTSGLTDSLQLNWSTPGVKQITVNAHNPVSSLTATHQVTITDIPISGLVASNDGPTTLGSGTTLTASVSAGSNVIYDWSFGDGGTGSGAVTSHTYPATGVYTAVVTATNTANTLTAFTVVTVTEPTLYLYLPLVRKDAAPATTSSLPDPVSTPWSLLVGIPVAIGAGASARRTLR